MGNYDTEEFLDPRKDFLHTESPKLLMFFSGTMALVYFVVLAFFFPIGNWVLFSLLIAGEVFHVWLVLTFLYTVWDTRFEATYDPSFTPPVDVFITVAGEPVELVEETVIAAKRMMYPHFNIHILNDGYVANKENWRDIEALAQHHGVRCITRTIVGGAKAGNINNALRVTEAPLIAIFDADHVPHADFLQKTVSYFKDARVGFVQTPQFYKNFEENYLTRGSWEQQELFFGPICRGKNRLNAVAMCGTNMVLSRKALEDVGGMDTDSITEDVVTSIFMHSKGYRSVYVPEVLAEGLATEDLLTYSKQQFRWARGSLDLIFRHNPLFTPGLTWAQRIQYLSSASFFLSGAVVVLDMSLPILFLYTGMVPVLVNGMLLTAVFLPYLFLTLYCIQRASNFTFTFPSLGFSMGSFNIHLRALAAAATRQRSAFVITQKYRQSGNFLPLVKWHIAYFFAAVIGVPVALMREGFSASLLNNMAWAAINIAIFSPFIRAALQPQRSPSKKRKQRKLLQDTLTRYGIR